MKIKSLKIENFRAIKYMELNDLTDTVLIAGPNGCGKSCIFHAIRLLKSVIGGYKDNEWHDWFNEFQIRPENIRQDIIKLFQTEDRSLKIKAQFELSEQEINFLKDEGRSMLEYREWKRILPRFSSQDYRSRPLGYDHLLPQVSKECNPLVEHLQQELKSSTFNIELDAYTNGSLKVKTSIALQLSFSFYEEALGMIDYHGPDRSYHKEVLDNINLNIQTSRQSKKNHSLYNYTNKYANVKQEMAGDYIRELFIKEAKGVVKNSNLIETLKELFKEFFHGKTFLGPKPDKKGGIDFPVRLSNGKIHDINDLSSGEKEILFGYLRLRNSAPKNSIILLDEPELHLNPKLVSRLPRFYKKYLVDSLKNQLWLVTHSDGFLRQAVEEKEYQVYHLQNSQSLSYQDNQVKKINANNDLEKAVIDLVGDLATYAPNKNIVLLEGENFEFDLQMVKKLFPNFEDTVTLLSVGSKDQVSKIHKLLENSKLAKQLQAKIFSIVDKDSESQFQNRRSVKQFIWDRYHIENYLLDEYYLTQAINQLTLLDDPLSEAKVKSLMIECARESINSLIKHTLRQKIYKDTFKKVKLDFDLNSSSNLPKVAYESLKQNIEKISKVCDKDMLIELKTIEKKEREKFEKAFENNNEEWKSIVKGRDILKKLSSKINNGVSYESLRNTVISLMVAKKHQPEGMKKNY